MISNIPPKPGCYIYRDKKGDIIYIGKAANLKKRVSSYFHNKKLDEKTQNLVDNTKSIDFIVTRTEVEALILENNLIKKHQPKYNINLKDSKRYAYLEITDEDFPRLVLARKIGGNGKFFGPFVSAAERDFILEFLTKIFAIRTCNRFPKRPCLRYHIKLCDAPCAGKINSEEYREKIGNTIRVLKGNTDQVISVLDTEMKTASRKQDFETAIVLRNQVDSLGYLKERQNMERQKRYDEDIINYTVRGGKVYLMLFNIKKGTLINKEEFVFDFIEGFFEDFLNQYYSQSKERKELILPRIDDSLKKYLKTKNVKAIIPKRGERKKLLELVKTNISNTFFGNLEKIKLLGKALKLNDEPSVIECFDISHLSGTSTVGSMVQFRNAIPDKSNYRRFRIRTVEGIDDTSSIREVVSRRYRRLKIENKEMPNLIIIDGGKGQLNGALFSLQELNLKIPIISIAKRLEEIYFPGLQMPLKLRKKDKALLFIQEIRDEAHRFAIKYNRLLRNKIR